MSARGAVSSAEPERLRLTCGDQLPRSGPGWRPHRVVTAGVSSDGTTGVAMVEFLGEPTPLLPDPYAVYRLTAGRGLVDDYEGYRVRDVAMAIAHELICDLR